MIQLVLKMSFTCVLAVLLFPEAAAAQQQPNVPAEVQQTESTVERAVERFRIGVVGGVGLDPELVEVGAHAAFGPLFDRGIAFRPGWSWGSAR